MLGMGAESLQTNYELLINGREDPLSFVQGLYEYLNKGLKTPLFRKIFSQNRSKAGTWRKNLKVRSNSIKPENQFNLLLEFKEAFELPIQHNILSVKKSFDKKGLNYIRILRMHEALVGLRSSKRSRVYDESIEYLNTLLLKDAVKSVHSSDSSHEITEPIKQKLNGKKVRKSISLESNHFYFEEMKIPIGRGQRSMLQLLFNKARIIHGSRLSKNGVEIAVPELISVGGYKNENAFRDALRRLREKIKKAKFPVTITNPQSGKYQMLVEYK